MNIKKVIIVTTVFLSLFFISIVNAGGLSVPPGYMYFRGIAWNSIVYDAAIKKAKEKECNMIYLTNLSVSGEDTIFLIKENIQISEVKGKIAFVENDMVVSVCKEVSVKEIKLYEGEYAIWKNGKLQKINNRLPIKRERSVEKYSYLNNKRHSLVMHRHRLGNHEKCCVDMSQFTGQVNKCFHQATP